MKKLIGCVVCAAAIGFAATAAGAGEVTGNGKDITIHANSICAFSGLEDDPSETGNRAQSWGQIPKAFRDVLVSIGVTPSVECNGHRNPLKP